METINTNRSFGGTQGVYRHESEIVGTPMRFGVYVPPLTIDQAPVLWWLSGLTCTEENFIAKAGAQRYAAEHGLILVAPDTSPRGAGIDGEDEAYDFGTGAGFYVDATVSPWRKHYQMFSYLRDELPHLIGANFPADMERQGILGHSMGGHGALIMALKNPGRFSSVSAFAPICNPSSCPWGQKALRGYLGEDAAVWRQWDAAALLADGARCPPLLIDQGADDEFLGGGQLRPDVLQTVAQQVGQPLTLRMQAGYDHSYFFIASFIGEHLAYHAQALA